MKFELFSVRDSVADEFGPVFEAKNVGTAIRKYKDLLSQDAFKANKDEFELFRLGTFDHVSGVLEVFPKLEKVELPEINTTFKVVQDKGGIA